MMSRWKCSYGKSCECKSDLEKSECDLAYIAKTKEQLKAIEKLMIYNIIRDTFHSQSGLFLNKKQAMTIAVSIYNMTNQNKDD